MTGTMPTPEPGPPVDRHATRGHLYDAIARAAEALRALDRDDDGNRNLIASSWIRDVETSAADAHQCLGPAYADTTRPGPGDLAAQLADLRRQLLEARAQRAATRRLWLAGLGEARRPGATPGTIEAALTGELQQAEQPGSPTDDTNHGLIAPRWIRDVEAPAAPGTAEVAEAGELQQAEPHQPAIPSGRPQAMTTPDPSPAEPPPPANFDGQAPTQRRHPMADPENPQPGDTFRLDPIPWLATDPGGNREWLDQDEVPTGLTPVGEES